MGNQTLDSLHSSPLTRGPYTDVVLYRSRCPQRTTAAIRLILNVYAFITVVEGRPLSKAYLSAKLNPPPIPSHNSMGIWLGVLQFARWKILKSNVPAENFIYSKSRMGEQLNYGFVFRRIWQNIVAVQPTLTLARKSIHFMVPKSSKVVGLKQQKRPW